jgi:thiamine kinase-like enzyme
LIEDVFKTLAIRSALSRYTLPNVPSHCDPMVENSIDDGERMFIIDFGYVGNNDPMRDLEAEPRGPW